jgi:hypothetical protein
MALPESGIDEIRLQLAGILRQVVYDGSTLDANAIADRLLGELASAVSTAGKRDLVRSVATLLERAASSITGLTWDPGAQSISARSADSPQTRMAFSREMASWLNIRFLESYSNEADEVDHEDDETE